jgi:hypothetical protein
MCLDNETNVLSDEFKKCRNESIIMRVRACVTVAVCMFTVGAQQQKTA